MSHTVMSTTAIRKLPVGTTVRLCKAQFVRFKRGEDRQWHEVPRHGVEPRTLASSELFLLGVEPTVELDDE